MLQGTFKIIKSDLLPWVFAILTLLEKMQVTDYLSYVLNFNSVFWF